MMQRSRYLHLVIIAGVLALAGWSGPSALAQTPPRATGLPVGFNAVTLGDTTDAQAVSVDARGVWTLDAGGTGLGTGADGGVGAYVRRTGGGSVIARLLTQSNANAQVALVFREANDAPGSRVVRLTFTEANLLEPSIRATADAAPVSPGRGPGILGLNGRGTAEYPAAGRALGSGIWIGIDRVDNVFGFYWSNDGKIWNKVGGANLDVPAEAFVGIEASRGTASAVQRWTLDSVAVSNDLIGPRAVRSVAYTPQDRSAIVTWNPVADNAVTYNLYEFTKGDLSDVKKIKEAIKTSSILVEGLTNGTPYRYAVSAVLGGVETAPQVPEPTMVAGNGARGSIGVVVPTAPVLGGFVFYNIGTSFPGSFTFTGTTLANASIRMRASGWDAWESGDGGVYLAMPMTGDWDVSARFVSGPTEATGGGGWELGGPHFRESLDPGSRFVMAQIARNNPMEFKRRRVAYQRPTNTSIGRTDNTTRPVTMRLVRRDDTFQAYYSEDNGTTWQNLGDPDSTTLTATSKDTIAGFSKMPYVGLFLTAHSDGEYTEANIDQIVIKRP